MKISIRYFPYYYKDGIIDVPEEVADTKMIEEYIEEHFDEVVFSELEFDEEKSEGCFSVDYDYDDEE